MVMICFDELLMKWIINLSVVYSETRAKAKLLPDYFNTQLKIAL